MGLNSEPQFAVPLNREIGSWSLSMTAAELAFHALANH